MQFLTFITVVFCAFVVNANPAIEREFHRVVNSNQCLKECMQVVKESGLELSIFKRSNYTDYLLKLDSICELITDARHCVDRCGIQSNPFALISVNSICSEKAREDAKLLEPCITQVGSQINDQCIQICGDYEQLSSQLHTMTSTINQDDKEAIQQFNAQSNNACGILKCSARCSADQFNKQCGHLPNGLMAGDLIRDTVERVLSSHRMDLQVFGLMDAVKKNSQPECNYLYTPEVLFYPRKDMVAQQTVKKEEKAEQTPVMRDQPEDMPEEEQLKRTESILQVRVLKKKLDVLNKQLELLNKEEQKMDANNEMPRFMQEPPRHFDSNNMF